MKDADGNVLQPGDSFAYEGEVEEELDAEIGEDNVLDPGEYVIYVPPGQRAIVRYELAATKVKDDDGADDSGVVINAATS